MKIRNLELQELAMVGKVVEGYVITDAIDGYALGRNSSDKSVMPYATWIISRDGMSLGKYFETALEARISFMHRLERPEKFKIEDLDDTILPDLLCYEEGVDMDEAMEMLEEFMEEYRFFVDYDNIEDRNEREELLQAYNIPYTVYTDFRTGENVIMYQMIGFLQMKVVRNTFKTGLRTSLSCKTHKNST